MVNAISLIKDSKFLPEKWRFFLGKVVLKLNYYNKTRPYKYLLSVDRFTESDIYFLGKQLRIIDGPSFYSMYKEIFLDEIYKLKNISAKPYILDCGANIGLGSIYLKATYPNAEIISFEPDAKIFKALKQNIHQSFGYSDVLLVNKGLWKEEGKLEFLSEGADGGRIKVDSDSGNIISIEVTRLSQYLDRKVDFLKIDIEGAEFDVLKEIESKLINVNNIFLEYHSFAGQEQSLPEVLAILKNAGFRLNIVSHGSFFRTPMFKSVVTNGMDMQLNVFGVRD